MSSDRELLERAAHAAGYEVNAQCQAERDALIDPATASLWINKINTAWNSLKHGEDTLRLEIDLRMTSAWEPMRSTWRIGAIVNGEFRWLAEHEDRLRATTLAAASIGGALS